MNLIKTPLAIASFMAASMLAPALAQAEGLSFNIGAVSLYKSRGVDQDFVAAGNKSSKNFRPAIQGGVDYAFGNGFYVGNWNSTGKFKNADLEVDLYGGYRGEFTKGLGYDVNYARYLYPNQSNWNANELSFSLSYDAFSVKIQHGVVGSMDGQSRLSFGYTRPLNDKLTFNAGVGFRNDKAGNFEDYSIGLGYDLGNALALSGTVSGATKQNDVTDGSRDARLVLGIRKSF